jgi:hypothetical protein
MQADMEMEAGNPPLKFRQVVFCHALNFLLTPPDSSYSLSSNLDNAFILSADDAARSASARWKSGILVFGFQ